ncbi:hypothetical protein BGX31_010335 [Mortierella sp. GBA43]|nr:hypothetical protein BGX31_010335 [Mortierella sp. GBA43]
MGRQQKKQTASHLTGTRPISSYFKRDTSSSPGSQILSSSRPGTTSPSPGLSSPPPRRRSSSPPLPPLKPFPSSLDPQQSSSSSSKAKPDDVDLSQITGSLEWPSQVALYDQDHSHWEEEEEEKLERRIKESKGKGKDRKDTSGKETKSSGQSWKGKEKKEDTASPKNPFDDDGNNPFLSPKKSATVTATVVTALGTGTVVDAAENAISTSADPTVMVVGKSSPDHPNPEPESELVELGPIDSLGLISFSPKLSGESIRRLALSPRKQKKTRDISPTSMLPKPVMSFAQRLAAEMNDATSAPWIEKIKSATATDLPGNNSFSGGGIVEGSDSDSDPEWNNEDIFDDEPNDSDTDDIPIKRAESDDDIPTLSRFCGGKAPILLDDSESDLEDNPFAQRDVSPTHQTTTKNHAHKGDIHASTDNKSREASSIGTPRKPDEDDVRRSSRKPIPILTPKQVIKTPAKVNKRPSLFSLDKLLKEKKRKEDAGYDLRAARNQLALGEELLDELDEDEDEVLFGPQSIPKGVFSEDQEGVLADIMEDEQGILVEDFAEFFVRWPQDVTVKPLAEWLSEADHADHVVQKVLKATMTDSGRHQFMTSPFLMIMSSTPWAMPRSLFRWLVHVVAAEQNQSVTLSAFAILQRALSQKTSLLGVDHQDLVRVFQIYGARDECLEQRWEVTPITSETPRERSILPETKRFPQSNLNAVIKLINMTATLDPQFYDTTEIRRIMSLLLRMTTDPIIGDVKSQIGSTMVALLDAIPLQAWETEPPLPPGMMAPNLEELHRALYVDRGFMINSETDYVNLGRRMQVFGFCLDDEQMIASYGRKALEPLLTRLRAMHGKIVDLRAAFMDRTIAKDMIQRLYMRMYYAGVHRQTVAATQSTLSFAGSAPGSIEEQAPLVLMPGLPI